MNNNKINLLRHINNLNGKKMNRKLYCKISGLSVSTIGDYFSELTELRIIKRRIGGSYVLTELGRQVLEEN